MSFKYSPQKVIGCNNFWRNNLIDVKPHRNVLRTRTSNWKNFWLKFNENKELNFKFIQLHFLKTWIVKIGWMRDLKFYEMLPRDSLGLTWLVLSTWSWSIKV